MFIVDSYIIEIKYFILYEMSLLTMKCLKPSFLKKNNHVTSVMIYKCDMGFYTKIIIKGLSADLEVTGSPYES